MTAHDARGRARTLVAGAALALAALAAPAASAAEAVSSGNSDGYAGSAACASCHPKEHAAWQGSQHAGAMEEATPKTVLGDFANASFTANGETTRFFRRDGRYLVNARGPDGKYADFDVRYTFGLYPLQQYLVALPGGRLQALGVAWDARSKAQGGQRWFSLYPGERLKPGDPLHWTGIDQNWNYQCADCHSTNLRKRYDAATRTFATTWSQVDVGCESCHGPASRHVAWAGAAPDARAADATKGLVVALDERRNVTWAIDAKTGSAARSRERTTSREIDACARCHARRGQFSDAWTPGRPLGDAFHIALLEPPLYFADGQMRDEVYNHGSFLQSRMHAKGVTCADCHEPHGQKLRAPGNAVCAQCHAPARFDVAEHHHHKPGSGGAACVSCHMPTRTYMVVDPRHDHSMRIPRPDRAAALGAPSACSACHAKQGDAWAAAAVARWYPQRKPGFQTFAEAFDAGDRRAAGASASLAAIVNDPAQPAIVRASALPRLMANPGPALPAAFAKATADGDALVRESAARTLRDAPPTLRARALPPLVADPVRAVRMEAARGLVGVTEWRPDAAERARFDRALDEYVAALEFNADRPEANTDLGTLALAQGRSDAAIAAFKRALAIDPTFTPAAVNLADAYRARGDEAAARRTLDAAIAANPAAAAAYHALGLAYVREKRLAEALAALGKAASLAPDDPRFAYVYAVALHDSGRRAEALRALDAALKRNPNDREMLVAAAMYERESGNAGRAAQRAAALAALEPDNPDAQRLARDFGAAAGAPRRN